MENRFKVQLCCECCLGTVMWVERIQLIRDYGCPEVRVRQIELLAYKAQKERETKLNSNSLMSFLDFEDILDFNNLPEGAFEEFKPIEEVAHTTSLIIQPLLDAATTL